MFTTIIIGGQEYKLALSTGATLMLEKKLGGRSALTILGKMMQASGSGEDVFQQMISMEELLNIFHAALQKYNANMTFENACKLFDIMLECGEDYEKGPYMELVMKCIEVISGSFFGKKPMEA